jgi:hypothetical protein
MSAQSQCNDPRFTSRQMLAWSQDWKVGLTHIQSCRPMLNSFLGQLRFECLNTSLLCTLNDIRCTISPKREKYNCEVLHGSLDYHTHRG